MKIKSAGNKTQEIVYMSIASLLALGLITYLIFLVRSMSQKATLVFGPDELTITDAESLQFAKYDALMEQLYPGSTTLLSTYGLKTVTSTAPVVPATTTPAQSTTTSATSTEL